MIKINQLFLEPYLYPSIRQIFNQFFLLLTPLLILFSTISNADNFATLSGNVKSFDKQPVIIYLEPVAKNKIDPLADTAHPSISSRVSEFEPAFQVVQIGSILEIKNNDPLLHNVHISESRITLFNVATPLVNQTVKKVMPRTGFFDVACDLHPWMNATLAVVTSPYYSVLWKPGHFQITNIVPGKYHLHSLQSEKDEIITLLDLKADDEKQISF